MARNKLKLWLLRPHDGDALWKPWFDKAFGFVVRATSEEEARQFAQKEGGDEVGFCREKRPAWTDPAHSTCKELTPSGDPGVIIQDFARA